MNVKVKGDGSIAQFINTFHRVKAPGHANFENILTKCADIGNDINISCLLVRRSVIHIFERLIDRTKLFLNLFFLFFNRRTFLL